jgi:hypothetical protein
MLGKRKQTMNDGPENNRVYLKSKRFNSKKEIISSDFGGSPMKQMAVEFPKCHFN